MEMPPEPMQVSLCPVSPFECLATDLKSYISTFLVVGKGRTRAAQLHNAAEALKNYMMLSKSFAVLLADERASKLLVTHLSRYTAGNLTQAGLALATVGARKYVNSLASGHNRWCFPIEQEINWAAAQGDDVALKVLISFNHNTIAEQARINAACGGHLSTIELLYAPGVSVSHVESDKDSPLIMACRNGHAPAVQKLLEKGEDPCSISREWTHSTALFVAAEWGHLECVHLLLANNARRQIDFQDCYLRTSLMLSAQRGYAQVVKALLAANAQVNLKDHVLSNALSHAVGTDCSSADYITIVQDLLAAGAEVNVQDIQGKTALFRARKNPGNSPHKKVIEKILLDHGAVE
jgi:ankyrin repeat protein